MWSVILLFNKLIHYYNKFLLSFVRFLRVISFNILSNIVLNEIQKYSTYL
jgi:hypothetical protein